ncbi:MAG: hypothetical protein ACXVIF_04895, partial [Halobacteriota archaeon]
MMENINNMKQLKACNKRCEVTSQIRQHSVTSVLFYNTNVGQCDQVSKPAVAIPMAGASYNY